MLLSVCLTASAQQQQEKVKIGELYYYLNNRESTDNEAWVTSGDEKYTGDIVIPQNFYHGASYNVTKICDEAFSGCYYMTSVTIPNGVTEIGDRAFGYCQGLTSINIPASVTSIGEKAFGGCNHLTSITVESDNEYYDSRNNCNAIIRKSDNQLLRGSNSTTVIPYGVTSIANGAFYGCDGLTTVTIPSSVTSIDAFAFQECDGLTSITIPSSVTSIGEYLFSDCDKLTSIKVGWMSPLSITSNVFSGIECSSMTLYVPEGAEDAYREATGWSNFGTIKMAYDFYDDESGLYFAYINGTEVKVVSGDNHYSRNHYDIPSTVNYQGHSYTVTEIGKKAFDICTSITSVTIPATVRTIGMYAFLDCEGLTSINIPASVTTINEGAFAHCKMLATLTVDAGNSVFKSPAGSNAIIRKSDNVLVLGCKGTVIPDDVTVIGEYAFRMCGGMTTFVIPEGVTTIGREAFAYADFTSVTIPESVTDIGPNAFMECWYLTSVKVKWPTPLDIGDNNVFCLYDRDLSGATLYVPEGTEDAYREATGWSDFGTIKMAYDFYDDESGLYFAYINGTQVKVVSGENQYSRNNYVIPSTVDYDGHSYTVTEIGKKAFLSCTSITSITIPATVRTIGMYAFNYCEGLTSINIPASVETINEGVFTHCKMLATLTVDAGNSVFKSPAGSNAIIRKSDNVLVLGCKGTVIPDGVTVIGDYAFMSCGGMTTFVIPEGVTTIGCEAFAYADLTSVTIPASVTNIGPNAFMECDKLTMVKVNWLTPLEINDGVFYIYKGNLSDATLYVPDGTVSAYEAADGWKDFGLIVEQYDFRMDGLYYKIIGTSSVAVTKGENKKTGSANIPSAVNNGTRYDVTKINDRAFFECTDLTSVTIPASVKEIGKDAFKYCTALSSVSLSNGLKTIGYRSFFNCNALTSISIPSTVTSIDYQAFYASPLTTVKVAWTTPLDISETVPFDEASVGSATLYVPEGTADAYRQAVGWKAFGTIKEIVYDFFDSKYGFYYKITGNDEVMVVSGEKKYTGKNEIPSTVKYNGHTYTVSAIGAEAFRECTGVSSVSISSTVKTIGDMAFYGCTGLTSVTIPASVTSIGVGVFGRCSGLTKISVNSKNNYYDSRDKSYGIIRKSDNAMIAGCRESIIPNTVTSIGAYTFESMGLTSIKIPNSVASIGDWAFAYNRRVKSVTIPASVTAIGKDAFRYCSALSSVSLSDGLETIGDRAFFNCNALTSISIPSTVTSIGSHAFYASPLASVKVTWTSPLDISEAVPFDKKYVGLATLYVPAGTEDAYRQAAGWKDFMSIKGLAYDFYDDESGLYYAYLTGNTGTQVKVVSGENSYSRNNYNIPSVVYYQERPYAVTAIGEEAFYYCYKVNSVTLPDGIDRIEARAFYGCSGLTSIAIPKRVYSIGEEAFAFCPAVESITVDSNNYSYSSPDNSNAVMYGNTLVIGCKNTEIPNNVRVIGDYAFEGMGVTSITIPDGVTEIGKYAFGNCPLQSLTIPASVTSIHEQAFSECVELASITVATGNTVYDSREDCNAIIRSTGNTLVLGCKNTLIPSSVTAIGNNAFRGCRDLTSLEIPESVTAIGDYAFRSCGSLSSMEIPEGVTSIGEDAFDYCSKLTSVTIPASVTSIGANAFMECGSLTSVTVAWSTPLDISNKGVFYGCDKLSTATLHVPSGTKDAYSNASYGWGVFGNIEEYALLVQLPDGVEAEAWTLEGCFTVGESYDMQREAAVAIVGSDIYVQGLAYWFPDAWMKGTVTGAVATFPTGQFVGEDGYGQEFMLGTDDGDTDCDIVFAYDAVAKTLIQQTAYISENNGNAYIHPWGYWTNATLYAGDPIVLTPVEVPEGLETETYKFTAKDKNGNSYTFQMQIGFDGSDVYFKGFSDETINFWAKGTLSSDGKTVTIPANQYMGTVSSTDFYLTALDEEQTDLYSSYWEGKEGIFDGGNGVCGGVLF